MRKGIYRVVTLFPLQFIARVPVVEEEWKVPGISYRREEVAVVASCGGGRGRPLGLPRVRLTTMSSHCRRPGLVLPPKLRHCGSGE